MSYSEVKKARGSEIVTLGVLGNRIAASCNTALGTLGTVTLTAQEQLAVMWVATLLEDKNLRFQVTQRTKWEEDET